MEKLDFLRICFVASIRISGYENAISPFHALKETEACGHLSFQLVVRTCKAIINTTDFNTIIKGHCKAIEIGKAKEFLEMLLELGLKPDIFTFNSIIDGLCQIHQVDEAFYCSTKMVEWGVILPKGGDGAVAIALMAAWKDDFARVFQYYLGKSMPLPTHRWLGALVVTTIYVLRVYHLQGFYTVSFGLGIYILNLLIGFLSPKVDPELEVLDGASLPTKESDEIKPFYSPPS
ncbi:Retrieval of early ER protein Rer1 [Dillenia turbinata]|uniref:Retrieval of early ER protein Rer1 n=1 Tax=Dillenia turbinata TaxID=194707 RepID=A0AAN8WEB4_9MAGN